MTQLINLEAKTMLEIKEHDISKVSGGFEVQDIGYSIGYGIGYVFGGKAGYKLGTTLYDLFH
ncbi:hypothetical protein NBRC116595_21320 [Aliiglaciecola sp. NS0011-25]